MKRALLAAIAAITVARIAIVNALPDQGYFAKYIIFADRIRAGSIPRDRLLDLSPLYLWFIVALRSAGAGFLTIRALQISLVSVAAVFAAIAVRRWGPIAAAAAAAFILTSRGALVCATELEPETLILVLNTAALAAIMNARPWTAGLSLGFSAACRPSALLPAIAMRSWRVIVAALIPVAVILAVNFALTHEVAIMDPGTVFYEGMNPNATGYEGVQPRVVNDLERQSNEPDYLHVAYRVVASGVAGRPMSRSESNRYWTSKAIAFARHYPLAALRLTARKLYYALQSYEAYDLATMARKDALLKRYPMFLPFGVLVGLALFGLRARKPALFAAAILVTLIVFYVTARQRNALLPAVAILAAVGLAEILWNQRLIAAIAAAVVGILLSINGNAQAEDAAGWLGVQNAFDQAIALENAGRWVEADNLLIRLGEYVPIRENRAVSSVSYYRARAAMHLGRDPRVFLERAEAEAPGNEHVLALRAVNGDRRAEQLLFELHDTFTARRALAAAKH